MNHKLSDHILITKTTCTRKKCKTANKDIQKHKGKIIIDSQLYSVHPMAWFSRSYKTSLFESTKSAKGNEEERGLEEFRKWSKFLLMDNHSRCPLELVMFLWWKKTLSFHDLRINYKRICLIIYKLYTFHIRITPTCMYFAYTSQKCHVPSIPRLHSTVLPSNAPQTFL